MTTPDSPEPRPWHTITPETSAGYLGTGPQGLAQEEARRRLERDGPNGLAETPPTSPFVILLHQFTSPLIYILLAATVVTLLLEEFIDAGVIAAVLTLNAIIGFSQERRAEQSVRALKRLMSPKAHVVRAGREWSIEGRELVAGDVVLLESGARVPADLRLFSATALRVDESLLTGESLPVTKTIDVALAVSAVPEGLPIVFTITLALAVRRMASRNAIVRRLPAVETLGSTTVIGSDKTGTLTENRMTVPPCFRRLPPWGAAVCASWAWRTTCSRGRRRAAWCPHLQN
jgi:magnesium-transporting ATPase (P-type)